MPDFDPNKREKISDVLILLIEQQKVSMNLVLFLKPFTLAAAFNEEIVEPKTKFIDLPKSLTCAGFPIREYDQDIPSTLTA